MAIERAIDSPPAPLVLAEKPVSSPETVTQEVNPHSKFQVAIYGVFGDDVVRAYDQLRYGLPPKDERNKLCDRDILKLALEIVASATNPEVSQEGPLAHLSLEVSSVPDQSEIRVPALSSAYNQEPVSAAVE